MLFIVSTTIPITVVSRTSKSAAVNKPKTHAILVAIRLRSVLPAQPTNRLTTSPIRLCLLCALHYPVSTMQTDNALQKRSKSAAQQRIAVMIPNVTRFLARRVVPPAKIVCVNLLNRVSSVLFMQKARDFCFQSIC